MLECKMTTELKNTPELQTVWNCQGQISRSQGTNASTRAIQEALNEIADRLSNYPECHAGTADGIYGQRTELAIKAFQTVQGLDATGEVDESTLKKLDEILAQAQSAEVNIPHPIDPGQLRMITYNDRFGKDCVLTFDDGPNQNTVKILDALKAANIHGVTFCVQGINVKRYPQVLQRVVDDGHVLANHTYDHPDLRKLTSQDVERQLQMCQDAVNSALGKEHPFRQMRPPYGALNDQVKDVLRALGLEVLLWQVDSNDWRPENRQNPEGTLHNVFGGNAPVTDGRGGLILFHDIHPSTGDIIPEVIKRLVSAGMKFTTAQALIDRKYAA